MIFVFGANDPSRLTQRPNWMAQFETPLATPLRTPVPPPTRESPAGFFRAAFSSLPRLKLPKCNEWSLLTPTATEC